MSLIKCPECGKEFSDRAKKCPQCACPIEYVMTTIGVTTSNKKRRIVRKEAPIRIKPYKRTYEDDYSFDNEEDSFSDWENDQLKNHFSTQDVADSFQNKAADIMGGFANKFNKAVDFFKDGEFENIIEGAMRTIDDSNKDLKKISQEHREKLFDKCSNQYQMLIDMRHAGREKRITVYNRDWSILFEGEETFSYSPHYAQLNTALGEKVFSMDVCDPDYVKNEWTISGKIKKSLEAVRINYANAKDTTLIWTPGLKTESFTATHYGWRLEKDLLGLKMSIYDADDILIAKVYKKIFDRSDVYVVDYSDVVMKKMIISLVMAIDIYRSDYKPTTLREKLDW